MDGLPRSWDDLVKEMECSPHGGHFLRVLAMRLLQSRFTDEEIADAFQAAYDYSERHRYRVLRALRSRGGAGLH